MRGSGEGRSETGVNISGMLVCDSGVSVVNVVVRGRGECGVCWCLGGEEWGRC